MTRLLSLLLLLTLLSGCVMPGTPRPSITDGGTPAPFQLRAVSPTHTSPAPISRLGSSAVLPPLRANPNQPFGGSALTTWSSGAYSPTVDALPINLYEVANFGVITGLTNEQQYFLGQNGFVVAGTQEQFFHQIREQVAQVNGQPYYLTTDAAYHALDQTLEVLLAGLEGEVLLPAISALTQATLDETLQALDQAAGTPMEVDAHLAAAYMAVALKLIAPENTIDDRLEPLVTQQVQQILTAGQGVSVLLPAYRDDFSVYKQPIQATAFPQTSSLAMALSWFGRAALPPGRPPQILTLALRRAVVKNEDASQVWARLYETIAFLQGSSSGYGPIQYAAWMDELYGARYTYTDLQDEELFTAFLARASQPPPLPDPPLPGIPEGDANWRFFPLSYQLDQAVLAVNAGGGLDLLAALGSPSAQSLLLFGVVEEITSDDQALFSLDIPTPLFQNNLTNNWLHAFQAQTAAKGTAYPPYMQTQAWSGREMSTALAAWASWRYSDPIEIQVPEPQPSPSVRASGPAPAFVEPNPDVFFRLAFVSQTLVDGLRQRGYTAGPNQFLMAEAGALRFDQALFGLSDLARKYAHFGAIAARELEGKDPTEDERRLIQSCLGPVECTILRSQEYGQPAQMPSTAAMAVVGTTLQGGLLQAAAGKLDRIFVAVPLEGKLHIAQGGVFSYYEFARSSPYKIEDWRKKLSDPPPTPEWTAAFRLAGGAPASALAIRTGDVLLVTPNGDGANLRAGPSTGDDILQQLVKGDLLVVQAGPVDDQGYSWWFVRIEYSRNTTGWVAGDPLWFERIH